MAHAAAVVTQQVDALVRKWTPYAESWAYRMDARYPGADFWPVASVALHRTAMAFDPSHGAPFIAWLKRDLRQSQTGVIRLWHRRNRQRDIRPVLAQQDYGLDPGYVRIDTLDEFQAVLALIDQLPPQSADWLRRVYLHGETRRDIARTTGFTRFQVEADIRESLARLRRIMLARKAA